MHPPQRTRALVIGGGPAGSTAATLLARQGIEVVLLERERFPRYHIGESLLPSLLAVLDLIGAREKVERAGFVRKPGAELDWGHERWCLNFGELTGQHVYSFQVERADFDELLLRHAASQGAQVYEGHEVRALTWDGGRPVRAAWSARDGQASGELAFDHLVDASGRSGLVAVRYRQDRSFHSIFKNIAIWGYWHGVDPGAAPLRGAIRVGSLADGWLWVIPLRGGTSSVGLVIHKDFFQKQRSRGLPAIYRDGIRASPFIASLLAPGELTSDLHTETDYSYCSAAFSGPGHYQCGDSACFLDPLLSTGVHLAMLSAILAAAAIGSVTRGELAEERCRRYFEATYRKAYVRLLVMVSAFYNQNLGQSGYFWEAQRLTRGELKGLHLRQAFLHLVTGIEDLSDTSREGRLSVIQQAVAERLHENFQLRQDKVALAEREQRQDVTHLRSSNSFMERLEGLFAFSPDEAVDGIYLRMHPQLRLATLPG